MGFIRFFGRFRRRCGDMEHRPEEPLGENSGDEQDWSNRTCGIGCELPMLAEWFPMTLRMRIWASRRPCKAQFQSVIQAQYYQASFSTFVGPGGHIVFQD